MEKERKEQLKEEAITRMRLMGLMPKIIGEFKRSNRVYYSERQNAYFNAILYWLDNNAEWSNMVKDFEKEYDCLVYHCQLTHTEFGDLLSLFYVGSQEEEDWSRDRESITNGEAFARVVNLSCSQDSDFGYVGIRPSMGGITRTW